MAVTVRIPAIGQAATESGIGKNKANRIRNCRPLVTHPHNVWRRNTIVLP
jgi:hypothetical protein